ncbi:MAG: cation diffusion facilitator family transporter [Hydrogenobaculum sp.]
MDEKNLGRGLYFVFVITFLDFLLEVYYGYAFNSLALLSDAVYMFMDLSGQALAIFAMYLSKKPPNPKRTFGYYRVEILSALFNGITAGFFLIMIFLHAFKRLLHPEYVNAGGVFWISVLGLLVNIVGIVILYFGSKHSLNIAGAFLRVLMDGLSSVGVIVSSILIELTGNYIFDPIMSILVGLSVIYPIYKVLSKSIDILMESSPEYINLEELENFIRQHFPEIMIKSIHVWSLVPGKNIMYARLREQDLEALENTPLKEVRNKIRAMKKELKEKFGFERVVIELY